MRETDGIGFACARAPAPVRPAAVGTAATAWRPVPRLLAGLALIAVAAGCDRGDTPDPGPEVGRGVAEVDTTAAPAGSRGAAGDGDEGGIARAVRAGAGGAAIAGTAGGAETRNIVFIGTSLTAGYGIGEALAYPAVIQQSIDSAGMPYRVVNGGISGETSAGGLRRIDWMLQQPVDVLVLELGANDGLRGLDLDALRSNLDAIIRRTRERYPDAAIVVIGMEAPPNMGAAYTDRFRTTFADVARTHGAALVPFLLDGVAGDAALNLDDGIHPNAAGQRILAHNVWRVLGPLLAARASG